MADSDDEHTPFSRLFDSEVLWRQRQPFLQAHGYQLRPRYRPGWSPSWLSTGRNPQHHEDFWPNSVRSNVLDATRVSDGLMVNIKLVMTGNEPDIAKSLSQPPLCDYPQNHSVPILDHFPSEESPELSFIVMPFLRAIDDPPFYFVDEVIDFVDQVLEGLVFLHENGIAHRDCGKFNIMMDSTSMYPKGFHPIQTDFLMDTRKPAPYVYRLGAFPPVKYYYIDFGLSSRSTPGKPPPLVLGLYGADREVPELSDTVPYNPFKVDIFMLGNVFKTAIHSKYTNVGFLVPLFSCMTRTDPARRPNATQALQRWRRIRGGVRLWQRMRRLHDVEETPAQTVVLDIVGFFRLGLALSRRFLLWAAHWYAILNRTALPVA